MEEDKQDHDHSAAFSWWSDSHSRRPHQSQWLQSTLSDLDNRIKTILNLIIQDDGDSFVKRAETFYKRRPELIKMVQDLYTSYCSLAEKYDQVRSEGFNAAAHFRSSSSSSSDQQIQPPLNISDRNKSLDQMIPKMPESCFATAPTESISSKQCQYYPIERGLDEKIAKNVELYGTVNGGGDFQMDDEEKEKMRSELRLEVSRLLEANLRQQSELVKRNEEKREVIKQLRAQVNRLMEENRVLKTHLPSYKVDMNRSQSRVSRLKELKLNCIGGFQS